jgi:hypothetical protein
LSMCVYLSPALHEKEEKMIFYIMFGHLSY